ncbi:hypothetical protein GCM10010260_66490 [Streptomyces filipinensis]|uniref:AhpC/TSA family protein n=1 Tax=Streptomyces filipinensis TaxID=66887 RepID=A0A918IH27_9ACTN|nr:hypothetical protein [Streptomyces filipinensis]GGV17691.1 hypothetical protein GCM10010260_66490 [Streptomyces filipinensis]
MESAPRAPLDPRVWGPVVRAVSRSAWGMLRERGRRPGGRLGLPADFLIGADGTVLAAKYGEHAYDQWPVGELLELASAAPRTAPAR